MADERMIKILLSMGVDEAGARRALEQFQKFQKSLADLEKEAQMVKKAIGVALSAGEDTKELEQELKRIEAVMREVRKQGAGGSGSAFDEQARAAQKTREELEKASAAQAQMARDSRDNAYHLRDMGEKLSQVGQYIGNVGNAILSPLTQASQLFLSTAAQSDPLVVRWKSEMGEIQDAWLRIGRVATEEFLPLLHTAAKFADKLADFVEANPDLIKIALGAGAGLKVAGGALQTAGSTAMLLGSLKQLGWLGAAGGAGGWLTGAGKAAGAFLGSAGGAATLGVGVGVIGYNAIAKATGRDNAGEIGAKTLAIVKFKTDQWLRDLGIAADKTDKELWEAAKSTAGLGEAAKKTAEEAEKSAEELKKAAEANKRFSDALLEYQIESKRAEEDYYREREGIMRDGQMAELEAARSHAQTMADLQKQYDAQVANIKSSFAEQEAQAAAQYQQQRAQAIADAQRAEQEARRDHLEALRKLEEEHNRNVWQITQDRDALALVEEERRYQDAVSEENRNFGEEAARRKQELQARLADMAAQYQAERAQRQQEYQRQLAEAQQKYEEEKKREAAQYAAEQKKIQEQQAERLRQLDQQYQLERQRRAENFAMQIRDLDAALLTETNRKRYFYQMQLADLERFIADAQARAQTTGQTTPGRASGGYATFGKYWLGEAGREFVINAATTRALENAAGGSLTHEHLLAMAARGSTSKQIVVNLGGVTFNGDASAADKSAIRAFMENVALQTFQSVMSAA